VARPSTVNSCGLGSSAGEAGSVGLGGGESVDDVCGGVDVGSVEELLRRIALLKNDLPQLRSIELSLVHATADGACVLSARARIAPVADARSDWFVRRLNTQPGETLPG